MTPNDTLKVIDLLTQILTQLEKLNQKRSK